MEWDHLEKLLDELLDLPEQERAARLTALASERPEVAARLREALDAERETPSLEAFGALVEAVATASAPAAEHPLPAAFGPWRPIERIASGGMGDVFLVRRADGEYEAVAALKRLRASVQSPILRERFLRERQLLADLHHPNIATLLDGGVDAEGVPYFVMEFVDGRPITTFADEERLDLDARLGLFAQVTAGVTSAHQRLVVHRDLKPDNILVSDGGEVKLVDFGIAKLLGEPLDLGMTSTQERLLTPRYAAPEQLAGGAVTTATDVYGLGVVLYELLSGCRPQGEDALRTTLRSGAAPPDPPRMSTAHGRLAPEAATAIAAARATTRRILERRLRGDLDGIVAKALRPDPADRYPTVASLADDLGRAVRSEPVAANRGSSFYRLRKFWTRHWLPATAVAVVFASLALALTVSLTKTREARLAERRADAINRFLTDELLGSADPGSARGRDLTVREVLDRSSRGVALAFAREPAVEESVRRTLGALSARLGDTERAREQLTAARALLERSGADPRERARLDQAEAELAYAEGRFDLARTAIDAAVRVFRSSVGDDETETLRARILAGRILADDGDIVEAERLLREIVTYLDRRASAAPMLEASARVQLASALKAQGRRDEALAVLLEAARLQEETLGDDHPDLAQTLEQMAHIYGWIGRAEEAEAAARRAYAIEQRVFGPAHWRTLRSAAFLAEALQRAGRTDAARHEAERALAAAAPALGDDHPEVAGLRNTLANLALRAGDLASAESEYRAALAGAEGGLGPAADLTMMIRRNFSNFLAVHGDREESLRLGREVRELGLAGAEKERQDPMWLANVAWFLARAELPAARDLDAALALAQQSVEASRGRWYYPWVALSEVRFRRGELGAAIDAELRAVALPDGLHLPGEDRYLVDLLEQRDELPRAERFLREQLARREAVRPADDPLLGQTRGLIGRVLLAEQRYGDAVSELRAALEQLGSRLPPDSELRLPLWSDLGAALTALGARAEAADALRSAERLAATAQGDRVPEERQRLSGRLAALGLAPAAAPAITPAPPSTRGGGEATPAP